MASDPDIRREKYIVLKRWVCSLLLQFLHFIRTKFIKESFWFIVNWRVYRIFLGNVEGNLNAYKEIFLNDYYGIFGYSKRFTPTLIVDIGAHIGMFSRLCSVLFPRAEILSYEPYPPSFEALKKNAKGTNIHAFPYAVSDKSGIAMLDTNFSPDMVRVSQKGKVEVKSIAASEIAKGRTIDLLKMDCEGSEWLILQDADFLRRIKDLRMEYHLDDNYTTQELQEMVGRGSHKILRIFSHPEIGKCGILWSTNTSSL